jgi:hypothetical protein
MYVIVGVANQQVISVPVCTVRNPKFADPACALAIGDHPFITAPSCIEYRFARLDPVSHVSDMVQTQTFTLKPPASAPMLAAVIAGLKGSRFVGNYLKDFCREHNI